MDKSEHDAVRFLEAFAAATGGCAPGERFIFCGFSGSPHDVRSGAWRPRPWRPGDPLPISPNRTNGYIAISTFGRAPDGSWRRRGDLFRSGRGLMVDDVRTKVPLTAVAAHPPTAIVETSPGNEQWWYWLREPVTDERRFSATIQAFIDQRLIGYGDPGMNGINRVGRIPGFINGKPSAAGHRCRLLEFSPERTYTLPELIRRFGLRPRTSRPVIVAAGDRKVRVETYLAMRRALKAWGMLRREANRSGWEEVECPWRSEHTARAGTGAAIREPANENEWTGAFACHHGHCAERGWRELEEWISDQSADALEAAADAFPKEVENEMEGKGEHGGRRPRAILYPERVRETLS